MIFDDHYYMLLCLQEAWRYQGLTYPNPPVGACITHHNRLVSLCVHQASGTPHAEVLALQEAFAHLTGDHKITDLTSSEAIHSYLLSTNKKYSHLWQDCSLYTTLAPCHHKGKTPACSHLIKAMGMPRVVIGSDDPYSKGGIEALQHSGIEVVMGVEKAPTQALLYPFLQWRKGRFVVFKYASRLNGTIDTDHINKSYISSERTLNRLHALRDRVELLIIGGNTVRVDRPTLDSRRVGGKAPDVLILSRLSDFDKSIPLFGVPHRKVMISSMDALEDYLTPYRFVMIEGVGKLMEQLKRDHRLLSYLYIT